MLSLLSQALPSKRVPKCKSAIKNVLFFPRQVFKNVLLSRCHSLLYTDRATLIPGAEYGNNGEGMGSRSDKVKEIQKDQR